MDMAFATMPVFGGEFMRLYRETQLAYIISDNENPTNRLIYAKEKELGSSILHLAAEMMVLCLQLRKSRKFSLRVSIIQS